MSNLSDFSNWRCSVKARLESNGFSVSFFDSPPSANNSMRLDFNSNKIEATIVAWEYGDIDFEAYDSEREQFIFTDKMDSATHTVEEICNAYLSAIIK